MSVAHQICGKNNQISSHAQPQRAKAVLCKSSELIFSWQCVSRHILCAAMSGQTKSTPSLNRFQVDLSRFLHQINLGTIRSRFSFLNKHIFRRLLTGVSQLRRFCHSAKSKLQVFVNLEKQVIISSIICNIQHPGANRLSEMHIQFKQCLDERNRWALSLIKKASTISVQLKASICRQPCDATRLVKCVLWSDSGQKGLLDLI